MYGFTFHCGMIFSCWDVSFWQIITTLSLYEFIPIFMLSSFSSINFFYIFTLFCLFISFVFLFVFFFFSLNAYLCTFLSLSFVFPIPLFFFSLRHFLSCFVFLYIFPFSFFLFFIVCFHFLLGCYLLSYIIFGVWLACFDQVWLVLFSLNYNRLSHLALTADQIGP